MKAISISLLTIFLLPACCAGENPFQNVKETRSIFLDEKAGKKIQELTAALRQAGSGAQQILAACEEVLQAAGSRQNSICEITLLEELKARLPWTDLEKREQYLPNLLLQLRQSQLLDDVALEYLLAAKKISDEKPDRQLSKLSHAEYEQLSKKYDPALQDAAIRIFKNFLDGGGNKIKGWKQAVNQTTRLFEGQSACGKNELSELLSIGYYKQAFCLKHLELMEKLVLAEAHKLTSTLQDYTCLLQKFDANRRAPSSFSCAKSGKNSGQTLRQAFYQKYAGGKFAVQQVEALGELMDKFQATVFESSVSITIEYAGGKKTETLPLSAVEQYHFAVKRLKKEIKELEAKYFFYQDGITIEMTDLIVAADEMGMLPAALLEEIATLEPMWNPEKPKKEKWLTLTKLAEEAGALVLPTPFNFILTAGIIVIEVFSKEEKNEAHETDYNLF